MPIFRHYRGMSKSLFIADRRAELDGMSDSGVGSCDRYCGEWCNSKYNLYCTITVTESQ